MSTTKTTDNEKKTTAKTTAKKSTAKTSAGKSTSSKTSGKKITVANESIMKSAATVAAGSIAATVASSRKSKASGKKSKGLSFALKTIWIPILVILLFGVWYVYGKPTVEIGAEGITITETEEPIIKHIGEIIRGEYPPETDYAENDNGTATAQTTTNNGSKGTASKTGTKGSSTADLGFNDDDPLYFGNPTDATNDVSNNTNYLMTKKQYTLSYNTKTLCPNWVAWHLDTGDFGDADRSNDFRPDEDLPSTYYPVKKADYQYNAYGYDRGHVCPSADRTATAEDNSMTFLMTNMVPQSPDNNRVIWMHFENYERELVRDGKEAYIIAGPYGTGGTGAKGTFDSIPIKTKSGEVLNMNVPAYTWKVLIVLDKGKDDLSRVTKDTTVIAINVPNQMGMGKTGDWEQYITTIDEIESLTGYDFFELLPDDIEDALESKLYSYSK